MHLTASTIPIKFVQGESFSLSVILPDNLPEDYTITKVWIESEQTNKLYLDLERQSDTEYLVYLSPESTNNLSGNIKARVAIKSEEFGIKKSNIFTLISLKSDSYNLDIIYNTGIDAVLYLEYSDYILEASPQIASLVKGENGLDNYEIAVEEGFVGTRSEWLDSMKNGLINSNTEEFIFSTPLTEWIVNHNRGYYPNVIILDLFNRISIAEVIYSTINQIRVLFSSEQTGKVIIN